MELERVRLHIKGKVQGVFFRASTKGVADSLGIKGWVRNLPDGSVEIVAEGKPEAIRKLIQWCKKGPTRAVVTEVEVKKEAPTETFENFYIRYD